MFTGFNHIGVAVKDIDQMVAFLEKAFGAKELGRQEVPQSGQISCLVQIGEGQLELMTPLGEGGVVGKFLEKNGPGLHHISLRTDDFDKDCAALEEMGVKVFGKAAMGNIKIGFAHPSSTGGVLYEIAQV